MIVYIDADACPVKDETYRVAKRYDLPVRVVSAQWLRLPDEPSITLHTVKHEGALDAADDWIVEHIEAGDVVVSEDILLASRCLEKGALALTPRGKEYTPSNIGEAIASRELMADLREAGLVTGGPSAFGKGDRSQFLQRLDEMVNRVRRQKR